jgi:predicted nucleotidyltransferase
LPSYALENRQKYLNRQAAVFNTKDAVEQKLPVFMYADSVQKVFGECFSPIRQDV